MKVSGAVRLDFASVEEGESYRKLFERSLREWVPTESSGDLCVVQRNGTVVVGEVSEVLRLLTFSGGGSD